MLEYSIALLDQILYNINLVYLFLNFRKMLNVVEVVHFKTSKALIAC